MYPEDQQMLVPEQRLPQTRKMLRLRRVPPRRQEESSDVPEIALIERNKLPIASGTPDAHIIFKYP
jgi:hypothetical protein